MADITVLLPVYNEDKNLVIQAMESILTQTFNDFCLLVALDNPENEIIKKIMYTYCEKDKRIKFIINSHNMGLANSLNNMLKYVETPFIARMDADDISFCDRLEKQYNYMKKNDIDILGTNIIDISQDGEIIRDKNKAPLTDKYIKKVLKYDNCIAHPTWFVKKTVYDHLSGYRDIFACEDYDFLIRASICGFKLGNLQENLLYYRKSPDGISMKNTCIQKATAEFLRIKQNKQIIEKIEIDEYLSSEKGRKEINKWRQYYDLLNELKENNQMGIRGVLKLLNTSCGRIILKNAIMVTIYSLSSYKSLFYIRKKI